MQWTGNLAVHQLLEIVAYLAGGFVYATQRARRRDAIYGAIDDASRFTVIAGAAVGAMIGTRLLFWLCDPRLTLAHPEENASENGEQVKILASYDVKEKLDGQDATAWPSHRRARARDR